MSCVAASCRRRSPRSPSRSSCSGIPLAFFGARYIYGQEVQRVETRAQDLLASLRRLLRAQPLGRRGRVRRPVGARPDRTRATGGDIPASVTVNQPDGEQLQSRAIPWPAPPRPGAHLGGAPVMGVVVSVVGRLAGYIKAINVVVLVVVGSVVAFAAGIAMADLAGQPADAPLRVPRRVGRTARRGPGAAAARAVGRRGDRPRRGRAGAQRRPDGGPARGRATVRLGRLPPAAHAAHGAVDAAGGDHDRPPTDPDVQRGGPDLARAGRAAGRGSSTTCWPARGARRAAPPRPSRRWTSSTSRRRSGSRRSFDGRAPPERRGRPAALAGARHARRARPGARHAASRTPCKHGAGTTTVRSRTERVRGAPSSSRSPTRAPACPTTWQRGSSSASVTSGEGTGLGPRPGPRPRRGRRRPARARPAHARRCSPLFLSGVPKTLDPHQVLPGAGPRSPASARRRAAAAGRLHRRECNSRFPPGRPAFLLG